jgi:hypothetical protein
MPFQIKITIEVALLLLFKRHWQHRSDSYMRRSLREYIDALRYIRSK